MRRVREKDGAGTGLISAFHHRAAVKDAWTRVNVLTLASLSSTVQTRVSSSSDQVEGRGLDQ